MIPSAEIDDHIPPIAIEEWMGNTYADIPAIPQLEVDPTTYGYVSQGAGNLRELPASGQNETLGIDGVSRCSVLLVFNPESSLYTVAHLEPYEETIVDYLAKEPDTARQAILITGSQSDPQPELEGAISSGYVGPVNLRRIEVESGDTSWGMVFNRQSGQVKTFARSPQQSIATYQLFPPSA